MYYKYLGDNCIQNFHLGRYIVGYTVGNLVLRRRVSGAVNVISERIFDDLPPKMKILNMVIPILMHYQKDSENVLCCAYTSSGCQLHKTACQLHTFTCQPMESDVT